MHHEVSLHLTRAKEDMSPVNEKETEFGKEWIENNYPDIQ